MRPDWLWLTLTFTPNFLHQIVMHVVVLVVAFIHSNENHTLLRNYKVQLTAIKIEMYEIEIAYVLHKICIASTAVIHFVKHPGYLRHQQLGTVHPNNSFQNLQTWVHASTYWRTCLFANSNRLSPLSSKSSTSLKRRHCYSVHTNLQQQNFNGLLRICQIPCCGMHTKTVIALCTLCVDWSKPLIYFLRKILNIFIVCEVKSVLYASVQNLWRLQNLHSFEINFYIYAIF